MAARKNAAKPEVKTSAVAEPAKEDFSSQVVTAADVEVQNSESSDKDEVITGAPTDDVAVADLTKADQVGANDKGKDETTAPAQKPTGRIYNIQAVGFAGSYLDARFDDEGKISSEGITQRTLDALTAQFPGLTIVSF